MLAGHRVCAEQGTVSGESAGLLRYLSANIGPETMTLNPLQGTNVTGKAIAMMEKNEICSNFSLKARKSTNTSAQGCNMMKRSGEECSVPGTGQNQAFQ